MKDECTQLLHTLMMTQFAIIETALYLNTHPGDQRALAQHKLLSDQFRKLVDEYESQCSPLTIYGRTGKYWNYINSPWPWEVNY